MRHLIIVLPLFFCASNAAAWAPIAYPLTNWGEMTSDFNKVQGYESLGWVQQGVDWFKAPGDLTFDTFGGYYWMQRTLNQTYFDENAPYVGAMFSRGSWSVGGQYYWETFPALGQYTGDFQPFITWYKVIDLGKPSWLSKKALDAPFSTWGRLEHDSTAIQGYTTMGWFQQGIDWFKLPGGIVFDTFGAFRWMERSRDQQYFDEVDPAVGFAFIRGSVYLNIEYDWERYPDIPETVEGPQIYLSWYFSYDLKKLMQTPAQKQ
jgi:hypothetical protein